MHTTRPVAVFLSLVGCTPGQWAAPPDGADRGRLSATADTTLDGLNTGDQLGLASAGAGDVDNDGYDDIILGSWTSGTASGAAFVHHGSATGISTVATTNLYGGSKGDGVGFAVDGAGDVNGDGYDDVIVGAPYVADDQSGQAFVYLGSASGVSTTAVASWVGAREDGYGYAVAGAGDVNGDGFADVLVGAPTDSLEAGYADLYLGSASGPASSPAARYTGSLSTDGFAMSVDGAGDAPAGPPTRRPRP